MTLRRAVIETGVPFHDLDPMDVVWHGNYFRYFELARCALLQSFDYDYPQMKASGYAWPIVETSVKYVRPARYGQRLQVEAQLLEWENRLRIAYEVRDADTGERLTRASTTQVAIAIDNWEMQLVSPPVLAEKLAAHPVQS